MALQWEGQIANGSEFNTGGVTAQGRLYCDVSRTNNTISVTGIRVGHKANSSVYFDAEWQADAWVQGSKRLSNSQTKGKTGGSNISGIWYYSSTASHSFSVGTGSGNFSLSGNWKSNYFGDGGSPRSDSVAYPAAGSPSGTTGAPQDITTTSVKIRNNVTSWGSYCTAGSVRSYRADNSGFSGQTYIGTTDNALVTHSGLTPNKKYWFRGWQSNGAGLSAYQGSTRTAVTLPLAPVASTAVVEATTATIPTTTNVGGGEYTITKQYALKEGDGAWGAWTTYAGDDIELEGLTPNAEYEIKVRSTTTAGTTEGATTSFTTMPAGKLIYPNGTVVNVVPRLVNENGTVTMLNVTIVD